VRLAVSLDSGGKSGIDLVDEGLELIFEIGLANEISEF
jgi:hypothetical protein